MSFWAKLRIVWGGSGVNNRLKKWLNEYFTYKVNRVCSKSVTIDGNEKRCILQIANRTISGLKECVLIVNYYYEFLTMKLLARWCSKWWWTAMVLLTQLHLVQLLQLLQFVILIGSGCGHFQAHQINYWDIFCSFQFCVPIWVGSLRFLLTIAILPSNRRLRLFMSRVLLIK